MGEFFKGWRRKGGLVTLAMALLLTVGWVRSYALVFNAKVESADGIVTISTVSIPEGVAISGQHGFCWRVPYGLIVWPLTLFSVWLILAKPRPAPKPRATGLVNSN